MLGAVSSLEDTKPCETGYYIRRIKVKKKIIFTINIKNKKSKIYIQGKTIKIVIHAVLVDYH